MPMLGLGYLASIARKERHEVVILDCKKEKMDYQGFAAHIKNNDYDLIGFQVFSYDVDSVKRHIGIIREHSKTGIVIAGGAHPSLQLRGGGERCLHPSGDSGSGEAQGEARGQLFPGHKAASYQL